MPIERKRGFENTSENKDGRITISSESFSNNPNLMRGIGMDPESFAPEVTIRSIKLTKQQERIASERLRSAREKLGIILEEQKISKRNPIQKFIGKFRK